jgi:hypothetical protein
MEVVCSPETLAPTYRAILCHEYSLLRCCQSRDYAASNGRTVGEERTGNAGFVVLTAVVMKCTVFWDITPGSPMKANRRFGGIYRLHLQGRRISRARNQRECRWQAEPSWKGFERSGRGLIEVLSRAGLRKTTIYIYQDNRVPIDIRTEHLPNTRL